MHREQANMVVITQPEQPDSQQRIAAQIKWPPRFLNSELLHCGNSLALVQESEIHDWQQHRICISNHLPRLTVARDERRAQCFMPSDHFSKRLFDGRYIQWPTKTQASRKIVEIPVRLELIEKPQSSLGKRE